MTEKTIDLSKYAAGKKLRCTDASSFTRLTIGKVYESLGVTYEGTRAPNVRIVEDDGEQSNRLVSRFVPVEDEAPECLCSPEHRDGINQLCPEHGRRCSDPNCDRLSFGPNEWLHYVGRRKTYYCNDGCMRAHHHSPAISPGHAIREPVRLNEAQREAVGSDHNATCGCGERFHKHDGIGGNKCSACIKPREWDADKYNGISAAAFQAQSTLDKRIAVAKAELDDGSRMKAFPKEGRLCRVYKENDR